MKACVDSACTGGAIATDVGGITGLAKIRFEGKVGINYTFHIEQFGNAPEEDYPEAYSLSIDFNPKVDCWEPNDRLLAARGIELGKEVQAYMLAGFENNSIPSSDFVDWYAIDLRHTGTIQATVNPPPGNHLMRLTLEDDQGNSVPLANQQDSAGSAFTVKSNRAVNPGMYYLRVYALVADDGRATGNNTPPAHWTQQYTLSVTRR